MKNRQLDPAPAPSQHSRDSSLSLWDLEHELAEAVSEYMELQSPPPGGEPIPEQELESQLQILETIINGYLEESRGKRDRLARFVKYLRKMEETHAEEIRRLQTRKRAMENTRARLMSYVRVTMQSLGIKKLEGEFHKFTRQRTPMKVEIVDRDAVPAKYCVVKDPEPSATLLKEAFNRGVKKVPGVEFQVDNETVVIR